MNQNVGTETSVCRVCVLYSTDHGNGQDYLTSPSLYMKEGEVINGIKYTFNNVMIKKQSSYSTIRRLIRSGMYDIYYNQCDGAKDEESAGVDVVLVLEEFNVPFTGVTSKHYEFSKVEMKMLSYYNKIPTARHEKFNLQDENQVIIQKITHFNFPVIVKHASGYNSIGMTKNSKCHSVEEAVIEISRFLQMFTECIVEEFITGEEATVLVCQDSSQVDGVRVFSPVKVNFPPGEDFKHFDLKWEPSRFNDVHWEQVPEDHPSLDQLKQSAKVAFKKMLGGVGLARVDFRINSKTGEVVFLEINPNPGIFFEPGAESSADWILKLDSSYPGSHRAFILMQIQSAFEQHKKIQVPFSVRFSSERGYFVAADRMIEKGELLFQDEGKPHPVATVGHVEKTWSDEDKHHFSQYAWPCTPTPIADETSSLYFTWHDDHKLWRPVNHSCNPNMIFDGHSLNTIARRRIEKDEEIAMDYVTYNNTTMAPFDCNCNETNCRGFIKSDTDGSISSQYEPNTWIRYATNK